MKQRAAGANAVLIAMTVANAMVLVDQTAVPLILPSVIGDFQIGSQQAQWVINASLLALSALLIFGGRLSDVLGRRHTFVIGTALFAAASACAGLAPSFPILLVFRVIQGAGGALMLPTTIAIVSATFAGPDRGKALGTMGGAAAVAGAFGPVIGGALTSTLGWRSVLLINVPLAIAAVAVALKAVPVEKTHHTVVHMDLPGTVLLSVGLIGLILGLGQTQVWGWGSPGVWGPLVLSAAAASVFVMVERRREVPLVNFSMLRRYSNYRGAVVSQALAGMTEMGIGVILPLLLILNLGMDPGLAGLALIPTTVPMVLVAPLAGRWYDKVGGRLPMVAGFVVMVVAGAAIAVSVHANNYWVILPGLAVLGVGLAVVLTVNDPVSLDMVPESGQGEASGVSATAEQFGGAVGIAVLTLALHSTYVNRLITDVDASPLANLTPEQLGQLKQHIIAAEQTGLNPSTFDPSFQKYLDITLRASDWGFSAAFIAVAVLSALGALVAWRMVRRPPVDAEVDAAEPQTTPASG